MEADNINYIKESTNIVFFGGAGVSTESGIPDFRSKDGLYNQHDVMFYRNASSQYIKDNPDSKFRGYREFVNNSDICDLYCLIDKAMEELND